MLLQSPFSDGKVYKSLPRNKCPSKCLVCRNPAIGYHYDVSELKLFGPKRPSL